MASLDRKLRQDLKNTVTKARRVAEAGARQAVEQLAVGHHEPWSALSPDQRKLRNRLRAHGRQLGDKLDEKKGTQTIDRLTGECAYEHWHRLLFARFLAENGFLVEPQSGMELSLGECRELARDQGKDWLLLASDFAQRMLPQIFRAGDPVLELTLPPEKRQELEAILERLPREVFIADDSLGWVYQFWQEDQKEAINKSGNKIGADELPAVTQLFTEDYMVLFLLHNTLGAWWAGKVLAAKPDVARSAASEDECRAACAVQGIEWSYLRFVREGDVWRPAAGTFPGWPTAAKDLTVLDPCMGSGHFLAFALPMMVALRQGEAQLSVAEAVDAVLRDNLFGLELDPRCTQIAAFNVGLTAWKLAGYRPLPALNLACSGLAINATATAWTALAAGDALAESAMKELYELFRQAPILGSLIDPTRIGGELFVASFDKIRGLLSVALATEQSEAAELAVVAQGIAKAALILASRYTLVLTNVPYLKRANQSDALKEFSTELDEDAHSELATTFLAKMFRDLEEEGTIAVVTPQSLTYQRYFARLRRRLLGERRIRYVAKLGPHAFQTITGEVVQPILFIADRRAPTPDHVLAYADHVDESTAVLKAEGLRTTAASLLSQYTLLASREHKISAAGESEFSDLSHFADCFQGICTGDIPRFGVCFWELPKEQNGWVLQHSTPEDESALSGCTQALLWDGGAGRLHRQLVERLGEAGVSSWIRGLEAWSRTGVAIAQMQSLRAGWYLGRAFDNNTAVIVPKDPAHLTAIYAYCRSEQYRAEVLEIDQSIKISNKTLLKVPFDLDHWEGVARERYLDGVPAPSSSDPTQWIFAGHPSDCNAPVQVAVARLVGYRWPRQTGSSFVGCPSVGPDRLEQHADDDGIVCLPSLRGEAPAAERVQALLADAFGAEWSAQKVAELLAGAGVAGRSLNDWLRDGYFDQHCDLFDQRPFVWQIWDGRKDGFSALVNYHQLAAPDGEGRRVLDKLTHTYLGDWLERQRADQKAGVEGADGRVAAAEHLKRELEKILEGEQPYDIFARWKPLHQQPVGWEPDIDDGVRVNIRPFMTAKPLNPRSKNACILRVTPKIKWEKDRGKEPTREKDDFPWFWGWDESAPDFAGGEAFDGNRWNDLHYSRAAKLAARERARRGP